MQQLYQGILTEGEGSVQSDLLALTSSYKLLFTENFFNPCLNKEINNIIEPSLQQEFPGFIVYRKVSLGQMIFGQRKQS